MTVQERLENVNEGCVLVCFCLFWWVFLIGARADNILVLPYWAVFFPLWIWKCTVFIGWFMGVVVWLRQRRNLITSTLDPSSAYDPALPYIQAMSVSAFFSLLLGCSELFLCLHLSIPSLQLAYLTILTPLLLVGLLGIFGFFFVMIDSRSTSVWSRRHRGRHRFRFGGRTADEQLETPAVSIRPRRVCTFTLELCVAANLLQLLFLIARLDNWIRSKWIVTFIPTFILLGMGFLFCTVGFIVALIRYFTAFFVPIEQRRLPIYYYASHILMGFLICTAVAFLALRLDGQLSSSQMSYSLICTPILISLVIYMINAFCFGPGNPWWFGLNRTVLLAVFEACPTLQLCANTSVNTAGLWKSPERTGENQSAENQPARTSDSVPPSEVTDSISRYYLQPAEVPHDVPSASMNGQLVCPIGMSTTNSGLPSIRPRHSIGADGSSPHEDPTQPLLKAVAAAAVVEQTVASQPQQRENVRHPD